MTAFATRPWTPIDGGLALTVRLTPKGGRDAIDGVETLADGHAVLKARVRAAPSDGEANDALCRLLAKALGVPRTNLTIAAGAAARIKRVTVAGDSGKIVAALERLVSAR